MKKDVNQAFPALAAVALLLGWPGAASATQASYNLNLGLSGTVLDHAAAADQNSLTLDFGNVSLNSAVSPLNFSIYNQGGRQDFSAFSTAGAYSAVYSLSVGDAPAVAGNNHVNRTLQLNLVGNITAVPLPAAAWTFLLGLLGVLGLKRKKELK